MKKHIPNFITSCNLLSGCAGIVFTFQGKPDYAVYFIWLALVLDFADGMAARLLNVRSAIGKELDSLADMVSFGVLPALLMFFMLQQKTAVEWLPFSAFLIAVFSALRLAKFNIDTRQEENFIGLPTPANALFISSLIFFSGSLSLGLLMAVTIIFSFLLIAEIPLFSLKFNSLNWSGNQVRYIFLLLTLLLIVLLQLTAIPFIIIGYILLSLIDGIYRRRLRGEQ